MQIPHLFEYVLLHLFSHRVSLATIGVCVFCAVTSVAALFIFGGREMRKFGTLLAAVALAAICCIFLLPAEVQAATSGTCGDNLTWNLDDGGTLTISGTGKMYDYYSYNGAPWYSSRSSIKAVIVDKGVTTIGNYAFSDCTSLTSVTIPDSVTTIEDYAFYDCASLTSVTIGDSVTTIGDLAFSGCYSLTSVTIPDSVTSIGDSAFASCDSLRGVYISDLAAW